MSFEYILSQIKILLKYVMHINKQACYSCGASSMLRLHSFGRDGKVQFHVNVCHKCNEYLKNKIASISIFENHDNLCELYTVLYDDGLLHNAKPANSLFLSELLRELNRYIGNQVRYSSLISKKEYESLVVYISYASENKKKI